jgi:hypothetical protein
MSSLPRRAVLLFLKLSSGLKSLQWKQFFLTVELSTRHEQIVFFTQSCEKEHLLTPKLIVELELLHLAHLSPLWFLFKST